MTRHSPPAGQPPPPPHSPAERALVRKLTAAYTAADLDALLTLLSDDIRLSMPPRPFEYHGRAVAARGLGQLFAHGYTSELLARGSTGDCRVTNCATRRCGHRDGTSHMPMRLGR
jgi:ketosteroid isomerase-like protein